MHCVLCVSLTVFYTLQTDSIFSSLVHQTCKELSRTPRNLFIIDGDRYYSYYRGLKVLMTSNEFHKVVNSDTQITEKDELWLVPPVKGVVDVIKINLLVNFSCKNEGKLALTVPSESIHTPWLFPHFVVLQPEKYITFIFCVTGLHTILHNVKVELL
jgi:molybdopterin converting factor small subunit